jgi:hypothetical protein
MTQHPNGSEVLRAAAELEYLQAAIVSLVADAEALIDGTEYAHDARRGWLRLLRDAVSESRAETTLADTVATMRATAHNWN